MTRDVAVSKGGRCLLWLYSTRRNKIQFLFRGSYVDKLKSGFTLSLEATEDTF